MKSKAILCLLLILSFQLIVAQTTTISGKATDVKGVGIPGVNIFIKGSYDGGSTNPDGTYSFSTSDTGSVVLIATLVTFEQQEKKVRLEGKPIVYSPVLKESINELKMVVISAGSMEASDEKRTTILKPIDIVTTANAAGDIYGALKTLPGTQQVGESEGLFVRGGTGAEAKTVIDGMEVLHPFFSSVPDIAQRGRFSPFLFKGTVFSTGGYSAQYGQALSSVLSLETQDLPDKSSSTLALSSVGIGGGHNHLWKEKGFSAGFDVNYTNLQPYYSLIPQNSNWDIIPVFSGGSVNFRKKTSETGIIKFYAYGNFSHLALFRDNLDTIGFKDRFELHNTDIYSNLTYKERLGEKYILNLGTSYSTNEDKIKLNNNDILNTDHLTQGRAILSRSLGRISTIRAGAEVRVLEVKSNFDQLSRGFTDNYGAGLLESDIYFTTKLVARLGGRMENSSVLGKANLAPRTSVAYKLGDYSQVSFAYGDFYQTPDKNYLYYSPHLTFEKATHYIANFQHVDDNRTFRVEGYYKKYQSLTTTLIDTSNAGYGYARGVDVFWRDKKTFHDVDYWISYSYLDTKRKFLTYPIETTPTFAAPHTVSVVLKKFFPKIQLNVGMTYTYATGRPYYNPLNPIFLADHTKDYNNFGINFSYLTSIHGAFTVFVFSVSNVFGTQNIYSYRYSQDGLLRAPVTAPADRTFFIGMFMSFGQDRRKEVTNSFNN